MELEEDRNEESGIAVLAEKAETLRTAEIDERVLRLIRIMALRRGIDYKHAVRMWSKGCLEIELRKIAT